MTVEFKAEIKDGRIELPEEVRQQLNGAVEVKVTVEKREAPRAEHNENLIDRLLKDPLRIENIKPLSREEAHARSR